MDATQQSLSVKGASAAIHIGFWRPETLKVAELAQKWGGMLLLSESAVGSLPPPLSISHVTVGDVDGLSFWIALDGFGYQIEDPIPHTSEKQPAIRHIHADGSFVPRGWVEQLIFEKPQLDATLRTFEIWDEDSYRKKEQFLSIDERLALAIDRFDMIAGSLPNKTNFLDNLYACPSWFLDDELRFFDMPVRARNVFAENNLMNVADLANKGYSGLLKLPNIGPGSVQSLSILLWEKFMHGDAIRREKTLVSHVSKDSPNFISLHDAVELKLPAAPVAAVIPAPESRAPIWSILDGFNEAAKALTEQERHIWVSRLGFRRPQQTLNVTADQVGLTRERVRQIESKIYRKVKPNAFWKYLEDKLSEHLDGRTSPLLLNGISAVDTWFKGAHELKEPLKEVFKHILSEQFSILDLGESPVITRLTFNEWENALNLGKNLLREMASKKVSEEYARVQINALLTQKGEELRDELWAITRTFAMWATKPDGLTILIGYGRTAEAVVSAILESSGKPLHYREIFRRSKLITDKEHDERRLHNAAQNVAVLYNRGTYGLISHCPLTVKELALIEAEVEDIAAGSEPTKQWHTSELLEELLERGFDFDGKLTKYIINIALRNSKTFSNMRRMVWGYRESWQSSAASRLDMRQAVMALLEEAGRTLSTLEIKERLENDRGVNNHFQIHPQGNLIRTGPGLWGLADRDIKVKNPQVLLDKLLTHLRSTNEGVHTSEVAEVLGDIDDEEAQALLGLINQNGMRRDKAQYVYLSSWPDARRIWPSRAIEQALNDNPEGLTIEQVRLEVKRLTKRDLNGISIGNMLAHLEGVAYNTETELWKCDTSSSERNYEEELDGHDH